jgi:hypothetical protein
MLIYRSFYEAIKKLPLEDQGIVWNAIFELGLNGEETDLSGIPGTIFILVKPQIEANIKRYQNGKVPKQKESKEQAKEEQKESQDETNKNKNKNNNCIEDRKQTFYELLVPFVSKYGKEMIRHFFEYWTEHGVQDKKMRFEKEKTFGLERRLSTWHSREKDYHKQKSQGPQEDKLLQYINSKVK